MFDLFKEKIEGRLDIGTSSIKGLKLKKGKIVDTQSYSKQYLPYMSENFSTFIGLEI